MLPMWAKRNGYWRHVIKEHQNHINRNTIQHSVTAEHRIEHNHDFDWNNIKILDKEQELNKRFLFWKRYKKTKNGLNAKWNGIVGFVI